MVLLTDFVAFVTQAGAPRIRAVRDVRRRTAYHPRFDYWKTLRDGIRRIHREGGGPADLDEILARVDRPAKIPNFEAAIAGYRKFWGRKHLEYFDPPRADYSLGGLELRINPELGLVINGIPHVIKLYFRGEPLSRQAAEVITRLMQLSLRDHVDEETVMAVLDVQRAKLYAATSTPPAMDILLEIEAEAYARIRDRL